MSAHGRQNARRFPQTHPRQARAARRAARGAIRGRRLGLETLEARLVLDATVVFNEVMYNPWADNQSLEWVELYNQMGIDMDLTGWSIAGGIDYKFPDGTIMPASGYLVVAADPAQLQAQTGFSQGRGPYDGQLANNGEKIELRNNSDRVMDSIRFGDSGKWPVAADGSGASLAKKDPMAASDPAESWTASREFRGTPGARNFADPLRPLDTALAFNEISGASPTDFWMELTNYGATALQLGGDVITSSTGQEYVLPAGLLGAGQSLAIPQAQLGFGAAQGDKLFLYGPNKNVILDGVLVDQTLRGRSPDGTGRWLFPSAATPGTANNFQFHDEIVINEIMYHAALLPPAGAGQLPQESPEQWIELYNRGATEIDLTGWTIDGGTSYAFAAGTKIAAGAYLVVTGDAAALQAKYPAVADRIVGDFSGPLSHKDDRVALVDAAGNPADEVHYYDGAPWPAYPGGGGPSLELRDADADNSVAETWAASDESSRSAWKTYTYRGVAQASVVGPDGQWQEFVLGLLNAGEVWLDDISVVQDPDGARIQLIQNGSFQSGTASAWRILGNHSRSQVIVDPSNAANRILRLVATGAAEHMSNHAETTLAGGRTINNGTTYEISYKARWIAGSNLLNTRLFFNRLAKTTLLDRPDLHGTPAAANSRRETNVGPTYSQLQHTPVVPAASQTVTVSVAAADPDGVKTMTLWYSAAGGAWVSKSMTLQSGKYTATIPGFAASTLVQFYVAGQDQLNATSYYPAGGANSRAFYQVNDGVTGVAGLHSFRILMRPADATWMVDPTNQMSNDDVGATVVCDGRAYYDVGVRLKGSMRGRPDLGRRGFSIQFHTDGLYRGVFDSVGLDRSGGWRFGSTYGQDEILVWHVLNRAGNIPSMYDDLVNLVAPTVSAGTALLQMARYNDVFLDSQYPDGSAGTEIDWDLIYYATTANGGTEGLKPAEPNNVVGTYLRDLGNDEEAYRYLFMINNQVDMDDYSRMIAMAKVFSLPDFPQKAATVLDVDEWLRYYAALTLLAINDHYISNSNAHNAGFYFRTDTQKAVILPRDMDFDFWPGWETQSLTTNNDLKRLIAVPAYWHAYYGHVQDILTTTYNTSYMSRWVSYYDGLLPTQDLSSILTFIGSRATYAQGQLPAQVAFAITTSGGNNFSINDVKATLAGNGWINVREIRLNGSSQALPVTWTGNTAWQITLPLAGGPNVLSFQAYDLQGKLVGSDSITVTSTIPDRPLHDYLRITELNYNPVDPTAVESASGFTNNDDFEFIELTNTSATRTLDLRGAKFTVGVAFDFATASSVLSMTPGERILLVRNRPAVEARYGTGLKIAGVYTGSLDNNGESLALVDGNGLAIADFTYGDAGLWPGRADGQGSTLEPLSTSGDYNDPENWLSSLEYNGTPGSASSGVNVVVNEVLAHTDSPLVDQIELYNTTADPVDISGWWLSDSSADYFKFQVPSGTIIAGHGHLVLNQGHWVDNVMEFALNEFGGGPKGFGLNSAHGDDVWLVQADADGNLKRFADHAEFGATANAESWGRWQDDRGHWHLCPMLRRTLDAPGYANSSGGNGPRVGPLVISEVEYAPKPLITSEQTAGFTDPEDMEFLAISNPTSVAVDLTHWRLAKGVAYDFAGGTTLAAGKSLLVVSFNPANATMLAAFRSRYGMATTMTVVGPYSGHLSNTADRVQLQRPDTPPIEEPTWYPPLLEDEVVYTSAWGATGDGKSLRRVAADAWGADKAAWGLGAFSTVAGSYKSHLLTGRYVFYNNSAFDGRNTAANPADDAAIATDKRPLLPGRRATFDNYTSYSQGINGVMVDVAGMGTSVSTADFEFRAGNDNNPSAWPLVTATPTITARAGAGVGGTARLVLTWPANAVQNRWLCVKVLATANTGLAAPDVFYFGNAIAETGDHRTSLVPDAVVDASDESAVRAGNTVAPALLANPYDFNRDRRVNALDELLARSNYRQGDDALRWINLSVAEQGLAQSAGASAAALAARPATDARALAISPDCESSPVLVAPAVAARHPVTVATNSVSRRIAGPPTALPTRAPEERSPKLAGTAARDLVLSALQPLTPGMLDRWIDWAWLWESQQQSLRKRPAQAPGVLGKDLTTQLLATLPWRRT